MVNFCSLAGDIGLLVRGTPANFNRFCVLALLLQQGRSTEADQTLHDVWPTPGLVHYTLCLKKVPPLQLAIIFTYIARLRQSLA